MNKKLVIFDFCETLVSFQTADRFIDYVIEKEDYRKYGGLKILTSVLTKLRVVAISNKFFPELSLSKRLKLYQIKGISKKRIDNLAVSFYEEVLVHQMISSLYNLLLMHRDNKDHILIVSGGYAPYIKYFSEINKLHYSFATEIEFNNNKATGKFIGKDCLYAQKVLLLNQYLKENALDFDKSVAYSDSITDLPLLKWANKAYVVSKNTSQKWAKENGLNEIIWGND